MSQSVYFVTTECGQEELSHKCFTWVLAAGCYCLPQPCSQAPPSFLSLAYCKWRKAGRGLEMRLVYHFWRTEGQGTLCISVWPKKNWCLNPLQCKKFNSWNLWVNLTECWNYLICMRFIGISTVVRTLVSVPSTDNDPLKSVERYLFVSNKMWKVSNCEISCCTWQGVVIPIGAVVTAVTGVKKRSRGQGLFWRWSSSQGQFSNSVTAVKMLT